MYPDQYVLATLRRVGVPPLWLEDALQEVRIREWRAGEKTGPALLHRWAIDAVRQFGERRNGVHYQCIDINDPFVGNHVAGDDPYERIESVMNAQQQLARLPSNLLRLLTSGKGSDQARYQSRLRARRQLREAA